MQKQADVGPREAHQLLLPRTSRRVQAFVQEAEARRRDHGRVGVKGIAVPEGPTTLTTGLEAISGFLPVESMETTRDATLGMHGSCAAVECDRAEVVWCLLPGLGGRATELLS